jgi:hypothetical protein
MTMSNKNNLIGNIKDYADAMAKKGTKGEWFLEFIPRAKGGKWRIELSFEKATKDSKTGLISTKELEDNWKGTNSYEEFTLKRTCSMCPEQYEVYLKDRHVAYIRLRHGELRVDYPDCGEGTIYYADTIGDGCFKDEDERLKHFKRLFSILRKKVRK